MTPLQKKVTRLDFSNLGMQFRNRAQLRTTLRHIAKCLELSYLSFILKAYYERIVKRRVNCQYLVGTRLGHWRKIDDQLRFHFFVSQV